TPRTTSPRNAAPQGAASPPPPSRPGWSPCCPGPPAWPPRAQWWREERSSIELDQFEPVAPGSLFSLRPRARHQGRAALPAQPAEPAGREVVLARLQGARRRRRRRRQPDQHLVDLPRDLFLARRDLLRPGIGPPVEPGPR